MTRKSTLGRAGLAAGAAVLLIGSGASASPGDVHRVTADRLNLRAGPSDASNVRSTVEAGDQVIELRSESGWLGVRVLDTGEEGWVFSDYVERTSPSTLGVEVPEAGFGQISPDFDRLLARVNEQVGYPMVESVQPEEGSRLRVQATDSWVFNASRDAKLMTALAIHQMWKSYNDGRPVEVAIVGPEGDPLIELGDAGGGPDLLVEEPLAMR